jgi:hypothetical protein
MSIRAAADAGRAAVGGALVCGDVGACVAYDGCEVGGLPVGAARDSPGGAFPDVEGASEDGLSEGPKCISAPKAERRSAIAASRFMELRIVTESAFFG